MACEYNGLITSSLLSTDSTQALGLDSNFFSSENIKTVFIPGITLSISQSFEGNLSSSLACSYTHPPLSALVDTTSSLQACLFYQALTW